MNLKNYSPEQINEAGKLFRKKILSEFLLSLKTEKAKSQYLSVLNDIENVTGKSFLTLNEYDGEMYISILKLRKLKESTILTKMNYIKSMASYTQSVAGINLNGTAFEHYKSPFAYITSSLYRSDFIEPEDVPSLTEINNFLYKLDESNNNLIYLVVTLIVKCGLNSRDLTNLHFKDITVSDENTYFLKLTNGASVRSIVVPEDAFYVLDSYISANGLSDEGYVLKNRKNKKMSIRVLEKRFKKASDACSFNYNMCSLRNAAAACMIAGGATRDDVASFLGLTEKWKSKYDKCVKNMYTYDASNMSNIYIKPFNQ